MNFGDNVVRRNGNLAVTVSPLSQRDLTLAQLQVETYFIVRRPEHDLLAPGGRYRGRGGTEDFSSVEFNATQECNCVSLSLTFSKY